MRDALKLAPITNNTDLPPFFVTHFFGLRWLATACFFCMNTHHDLLSLRGTNQLLDISQLMLVGLTVAAKGRILITIVRSKMDEAQKPQRNSRKGITLKSDEMHQVNGQNTLDSFFP